MNQLYKKLCFFGVLLLLCIGTIHAQNTVRGTVTSETGEPLIGATVIVKGTDIGTSTDVDGSFKLEIPTETFTLVVSYIGYAELEESYQAGQSPLTIELADAASQLEEVIVTGLATGIKRGNSANSVALIDSKDLTGTTIQPTMDNALYGKFKGVNISANSGAPGGGISIKLRGITSLTASSQPLFIVDGVYIDNSAVKAGFDVVSASQSGGSTNVQDNPSNRIADLDPEDIERVEVLKGASAAAIYGSRAGAGVVIITTKRGEPGQTKIRFSQSLGANILQKKLGYRDWNAQKVETFWGADEVDNFQAAQAAGELYDYEDELYGNTGFASTSRLSLSGGDEKTRFFAGATYKDEDGIVKNTGYEKTSIRLNLDRQISSWLDFGLSTNYVNSSADRGYFNNDNTGTTLGIAYVGTPRWVDLFPDENGNYPNNRLGSSNFLQTAAQVTNNESINRVIVGGRAEARIYTGERQTLRLLVRGGVDYYTLNTTAIFPRTLQFQKNGNGTDGASIQGTTRNTNKNVAAFLVHNIVNPNNGLSFRTQAGLTAEFFDQNTIRNVATFLIGSQTNLDQAGSIQADQNIVTQRDKGFFVQEEVNFDDKVLVTVGLRGDKSSNNGDANELFFYPKASAAVNLQEFNFWQSELFDQLKFRVAYGESGNFPRFGATFTSLVPTIVAGTTGSLVGTKRGNGTLGPERQRELEAGFDIGILDNQLLFDFTYYNKTIEDLVLDVETATSSGFSDVWTNVGTIENNGIEIGLTAYPITNDDLAWTTRTSFWLNRAEVTELNVPAYNTGAFGATLGTYRIQEGESPTQVGGIGDEADDTDGDGFIKYGDAEPDFQMSFANTFTYKNWELNFLIHWKEGGDNINLTTLLSDLFGTSPDFDDTDLDPTGQMTNGNFRLAALGVTAAPWIEDASYARLREVGLYYRIPKSVFRDVMSLRVGVSGRNLVNIFDYNSYDPEVSNFGSNAISSVVEVTPFPASKSVHFTVTATF